MDSDHDQEGRELEREMERALAVAIAHSASLLEAWAKLAARHTKKPPTAEPTKETKETASIEQIASGAKEVQLRARDDLASGRPDANFWRTASPDELAEKIRRDYNIEPTRLGDRDHDRHWAERAKGAEVVGLLSVAGRYADESALAEQVRDNLKELIRDYGLDPDEMMRLSPREAAEAYTQARAETYAPGPDPTMSPDGRDATDVDGVRVASLVAGAQAADERANNTAAATREAGERAGVLQGEVVSGQEGPSRAEAVASVATSRAGGAAATAARDHPTNPREATQSVGRRQPRARRTTSTRSSDRERVRGI